MCDQSIRREFGEQSAGYPKLKVKPMRIRLEKRLATLLYSCIRQAERSLHFALSNKAQWGDFIRYYNVARRKAITSLLGNLRILNANGDSVRGRQRVSHSSFARPGIFLLNLLTRSIRTSWRFSGDDLAFLFAALSAFYDVLDAAQPPAHASLIELRLDLYSCEWIIENRMLGIPELRLAQNVEHYGQSGFVQHVTLEEMGLSTDDS